MHPTLFQIHSFTVYSYGFFVALAVISAFFMSQNQAKALGMPQSTAADLVFVLFVAGVIGARGFFVLQHFADYEKDLWEVFSLREGGLVWYGGLIAAAIVGTVYAKARRWPLLKWCDFFSPVLAFSHAIGRIGCFFNGCCYGRVTGGDFGVVFEGDTFSRIPTQIYESAALFIFSFYLFWSIHKRHRDGEIFVQYLLLYGALRFLIEFFRGDQTPLGYLTLPQWMSLLLFAGALAGMIYLRMKPREPHAKN